MATTWSPIYPYVHWAGGSSYSDVGLMGIEETVLRSGVLGFSVDSHTALGTDEAVCPTVPPSGKNMLHGKVTAKTNNDGLILIDGNLNGALAKGWYFTAGVYANLEYDGQRQWSYNSSANFGRGREHFFSLYAIDDRHLTPKLSLFYGLRAELFHSNYDMAVNEDGQTNNKRHDGFYINDGTVTVSNLKRTKMNFIGVARANYQLAPRLFFTGEYIYCNQQRRFDQFRFETLPSEKHTSSNFCAEASATKTGGCVHRP